MKKVVSPISPVETVGHALRVFALFLFLFSASVAFSQGLDPKAVIGDLSTVQWKATSEVDQVLVQEHNRMDVALNEPGLPDEDRALFLGYQRMLGYVQSAVQATKPLDDAILYGYTQTVADAPSDPDLKLMPEGALLSLVPGLVELLIAVPVAEPVVGQ
ncbi:MAG: hypothetical protein SFV52_05115 [Saprospiraceae bacterium]|nr:hypothetical protein [Saprospiraceae bacterium]